MARPLKARLPCPEAGVVYLTAYLIQREEEEHLCSKGPFWSSVCATKPTCPGTRKAVKKGKSPGFSTVNWMKSGVDTMGLSIKHKSESWRESPSFTPLQRNYQRLHRIASSKGYQLLCPPIHGPPRVKHYGDSARLTTNLIFMITASHIPLGFIHLLHK